VQKLFFPRSYGHDLEKPLHTGHFKAAAASFAGEAAPHCSFWLGRADKVKQPGTWKVAAL
jgi:hypothetical protein